MRRLLSLMLSALFLFALWVPCLGADGEPEVQYAEYAYVYNPVFDEVMYEKKADKIIYPASTVKMMTGILAIEYYSGAYDTKITISEEVVSLTSGTKINYKVGEVLTVDQLLYGLLVGNGNDAAYALALSIAGTEEAFISMMNEKAKSLGATDTVYANPTGYDDNRAQTTARDLAKIAGYAVGMKDFIKYSSCERYEMTPTNMEGIRTIANKNWLVSRSYVEKYYLPYATGLNAGFTTRGGECCVAAGTKDGVTIVTVAMYAPTSQSNTVNHAFDDSKAMMKWAYSSYGYEKILSHSEIVCEIPVDLAADVDHVALLPAEDVYAFLPSSVDTDADLEKRYTLYEDRLTAPVAEGQEVGVMTLYYDGEEIGSVPLVTKNALTKSTLLAIWASVTGFLSNLWTVTVIILLILFFGLVIFANAYMRGRKKR